MVEDRGFFDLGVDVLVRINYSGKPVSKTRLIPDTVLALRTREGNFAKIRVIGYRDLHDFSFDSAKYVDDHWRLFSVREPNRPYHLEVEWTLYAAPRSTP